jgi:hypothetical protein
VEASASCLSPWIILRRDLAAVEVAAAAASSEEASPSNAALPRPPTCAAALNAMDVMLSTVEDAASVNSNPFEEAEARDEIQPFIASPSAYSVDIK